MKVLALLSMLIGLTSFLGACVLGDNQHLLVSSIALGLVAVITGILALVQTKKRMESGGTMTAAVAGICIGSIFPTLIIIIILLGVIFSFISRHNSMSESYCRISCHSNLKQIASAMRQYALDYNWHFPDGKGAAALERLRAGNYLTDVKIFICPSSKLIPNAPDKPLDEEHVSYRYFGGLDEKSSPSSPIACDKPENHKDRINILYADGHVDSLSLEEWFAKGTKGKASSSAEANAPPFFPHAGK